MGSLHIQVLMLLSSDWCFLGGTTQTSTRRKIFLGGLHTFLLAEGIWDRGGVFISTAQSQASQYRTLAWIKKFVFLCQGSVWLGRFLFTAPTPLVVHSIYTFYVRLSPMKCLRPCSSQPRYVTHNSAGLVFQGGHIARRFPWHVACDNQRRFSLS